MASPATSLPRPGGPPVGADEVEPAPEWADDVAAAARFGSPEAIRAGLLPEQVVEFAAALTAARRLDRLGQVLRVWRRAALLTARDPAGYRQVLAAEVEIRAEGRPRSGSVSWAELRAEFDG